MKTPHWVAGVITFTVGVAWADGGETTHTSGMEELVTYGQSLAERSTAVGLPLTPRETPQSLSLISREQIEAQSFTSIGEALEYTTGISVKATDRGRNTLSARGFEITNFQLDGVPFATGNVGFDEANTALYERIEVVRGATGLLNGSGEPAAAVNLVRKRAGSRVFTGSVDVEYGSWDRRAITADVSAPLNRDGSLRGRFVAQTYDQEAFVDLEQKEGDLFYGVIDADLGADTRLSFGISQQRDNRDGVLWVQLPYWYSDGTRTDWSRAKTSATDWNEWDTVDQSAFLTLAHQLENGWSLRSDLSYHRQEEISNLLWMRGMPDRETGLGMEAWPYYYLSEPEQWHLSAQASGPLTLWGRQHELVAGAMVSHLDDGWTNRDPVSTVPEVGDFHAWDGSFPELEAGQRIRWSGVGTTKQAAGYSAARLQLSDRLKLIVGGRLSYWQRDEEEARYTPEAFTVRHSGVVTPYAGILYDLSEQLTAYASYTSIFNPQTNRDRSGDYLDPLEGNSYEAGVKAGLMDGRLSATAAVFRTEQDNFAVIDQGFFVPGTTDPAYRATQGTVAEGYELEVVGEILPGWHLNLGWTHFSAEDQDDEPVQVHHPRRSLNLTTQYTLSGALSGLSLGGAVKWESQPPITAINPGTGLEERVGQSAYALVDLMVKYTLNEQMALQLNVENLLDKTYYTNSGWFSGFVYGEPRNARLTLKYAF